jgi:hypothetical protein
VEPLPYPIPDDEQERLSALRRYQVLGTPPEETFDRVTRLAAALFEVPISLITLVGSSFQEFKSCYGLDRRRTGREVSFCTYAVASGERLVVPDALLDPRFRHNPFVLGAPHIRFYAGCPLRTPQGHVLGTLCLIDMEPREPTEDELQRLEDLATVVMDELELRRTRAILEREQNKLKQENDDLEAFSQSVAHDLKNPLASLKMASDTLVDTLDEADEMAREISALICTETGRMQTMIDELLALARIRRAEVTPEPVDMGPLVEKVVADMEDVLSGADLNFPSTWWPVLGHEGGLRRVWTNLLSNAVKYGGEPPRIGIGARREGEGRVSYWVRDDGPGIPAEQQERIFEVFVRLEDEQASGHGVGLSIVKRILEKLGGEVWVESPDGPSSGTRIGFTLQAATPESDEAVAESMTCVD